MLIENTWQDGDICSIKMVNGEELVAKITDHDAQSVTIHKPLVLTLGVDQQNQQYQLQMLPTFMFSAKPDAKLKIDRRHIITITISQDEAKSSYISNTTNLAMPSGARPANLNR